MYNFEPENTVDREGYTSDGILLKQHLQSSVKIKYKEEIRWDTIINIIFMSSQSKHLLLSWVLNYDEDVLKQKDSDNSFLLNSRWVHPLPSFFSLILLLLGKTHDKNMSVEWGHTKLEEEVRRPLHFWNKTPRNYYGQNEKPQKRKRRKNILMTWWWWERVWLVIQDMLVFKAEDSSVRHTFHSYSLLLSSDHQIRNWIF
jgi:hypothetical protein